MKVKLLNVENKVYPTFFANRHIEAGEELTYNYSNNKGTQYWWRFPAHKLKAKIIMKNVEPTAQHQRGTLQINENEVIEKLNDQENVHAMPSNGPDENAVRDEINLENIQMNYAEESEVIEQNVCLANDLEEISPILPIKKKYSEKRPKRPCKWCKVPVTKLTRHVMTVHKDLERVKELKTFSPMKRKTEMAKIRKEGIFQANLETVHSGTVMTERKCKAKYCDIRMCLKCKAFLSKKSFNVHKCVTKMKPTAISVMNLRIINRDSKFCETIVKRFRNDEIGEICKTDPTILSLGHHHFHAHEGGDKVIEARKSTMGYMRRLATLFVEFKKCSEKDNLELETSDMFVRIYFEYLKEAINVLTYQDDNQKHGVRLMYGFTLKTALNSVEGMFIVAGKDHKAAETRILIGHLSHEWNMLFKTSENATKKRRVEALRRPARLPNIDSLQTLKNYILEKLPKISKKEMSRSNFVKLRKFLVTRLIFFNGRRVNEPGRITIKEMELAFANAWINQSAVGNLSTTAQKEILDHFYISYVPSKNSGNIVDLLIPKKLKPYIDILMNPLNRLVATVNPKNKFLFAQTNNSMDHCSGWHDVDSVVKASKIKSVTATDIRHLLSTMFAASKPTDFAKKLFCKHLGHSAEINENVYQDPAAVSTIQEIGYFLLCFDNQSENMKECNEVIERMKCFSYIYLFIECHIFLNNSVIIYNAGCSGNLSTGSGSTSSVNNNLVNTNAIMYTKVVFK